MIPLFGPLPGGPELLVIFLLFLLVPVFGLGLGFWVYRDAKRRAVPYAPAWALGIVALFFAGFVPGLLALAVYFYMREQLSGQAQTI
ncbi:hypothetical protein SAMN04487948_106161 [Halogranum amylolyticum]|uniref:Phospholipase_D-nuclease N-terminal n=1 Tax=Halogranum amylolyticum TaxID=660520 RepID=A0A1H8TB38_9EURY|nr:hypothetical protein [Halogranum amylolyticum]SEO88349.1 hypothetical protein SAMN04487948_106161 [Halogranum amylolyticum]